MYDLPRECIPQLTLQLADTSSVSITDYQCFKGNEVAAWDLSARPIVHREFGPAVLEGTGWRNGTWVHPS
jgi:hypothetical protein